MDGRVVLITGGASGIGRGAAGVFARENAVVVIADVDGAAGESAVAHLSAEGGAAFFVETDVRAKESCDAAVAAIVELHDHIDVLVCNAGIYPQKSLSEMTEEDWDGVFAVNVKGMLHMVTAVLPAMRARRFGRVVLVSSVIGAVAGAEGGSHYGASKAAMLGFMRSAAIELALEGVTINAVLPGYIHTEGMKRIQSGGYEGFVDRVTASIPMKRIGDPEDIGNAILYFASDEAAYVTGQTLVVDGGCSLTI